MPRKKPIRNAATAVDRAAKAVEVLVKHVQQGGVVFETPSLAEWGQFLTSGKRLPFCVKLGKADEK
jgi:hypothetical protein